MKSMVVDESKHQKNNGRYAFMSKKYSDTGLITIKRVIVVYNKIKLNSARLASEPSM